MLTAEEQSTNCETLTHIQYVRNLLNVFVVQLLDRSARHDRSENPELKTFVKYTPKLAASTYGSDEYKRFLEEMKPALDHHYALNRHHPEHFVNGVEGMDLIDLIEMLADWKAATLRHNNGDINKSIEINAKRFNISPQLVTILLNTVKRLHLDDTLIPEVSMIAYAKDNLNV